MQRLILFVLVSFTSGCPALLLQAPAARQPRAEKAPAEKAESLEDLEDYDDEEAGIERIYDLLREFRRQLDKKDFTAATRLVVRSERAIKKATVVTRSHPEFDDTVNMVERARERLEQAIEADRIARREAAIDDLIAKAGLAVRQGTTLYAELKQRVPTQEDIESLQEIVGTLSKLAADGRQYLDQPRYKTHAEDRDAKTRALEQRLQQAKWQLQAQKKLNEPLESAYAAAAAVREADAHRDRVIAFQRAAKGFSACANAIGDLQREPEYDAAWLVHTRLGTFSLAKTRELCVERAAMARAEADKLDWRGQLNEALTALEGPVAAMRNATSSSAALAASEAALVALSECKTNLATILQHPGAEPNAKVETVFGTLPVSRVAQACAAEESKTRRQIPALEWRAQLEKVGKTLDQAKTAVDEAGRARSPARRIELWQKAKTALERCVNQAKQAASDRHAERSFTVSTAWGDASASTMVKTCSKELNEANEGLEEARKEHELQQFIAKCKGDEISVARREGIPTRIDNVSGGRIFVYEKKDGRKSATKHYGFDTSGKRVDFRLRWLKHVGAVVSEVNRVINSITGADSGKEALRATQDALPVLQVCVEALKKTATDPGYDKDALFNTALGKIPASRLADACAKERVKRSESVIGLKWRIQLEALRDRVAQAQKDLSRAKAAKTGKEALELVGAALGGFTECVERSEELLGAPGADKSLTVKTPFGPANLQALVKACKSQHKAAEKELEAAMAKKELEEFIAGCKGDEPAVAKRYGIPTRIEELDAGRVFVYEKPGKGRRKSKARRIAFDQEGRRVSEKILKAMSSGDKKGKQKKRR